MAGNPKAAQYEARIEELGGLEWVLEELASGLTPAKVAEYIGCSRGWLVTWFGRDEERAKLVSRARSIGAGGMVEQAILKIEDLDGLPFTNEDLGLAKLRFESKKYLASKMDPGTYGEKQAPTVAINIGDLHLAAVREVTQQLSAPRAVTRELAQGEAIPILDAELVDDTPAITAGEQSA